MTNVLANIFGTSPVGPLEKHIEIAFRCAKRLRPFFAAAVAGDWDEAAEIREQIEALENEADDLKKKLRLHLPKSLFMPVPREDLMVFYFTQTRGGQTLREFIRLVFARLVGRGG